MHICILQHVFDPYKGANHLPLYAAMPEHTFTIVCNASKVQAEDLPSNVSIHIVPGRTGPYYYGIRDYLFAKLLLKTYPISDEFWKQYDIIHVNQIMGPHLRKLAELPIPLLLTIHHPVTADRDIAVRETRVLSGLLWRLKYFLLVRWQKKMCACCTKIVTVSQTVSAKLQHDYGVSEEKITVVPNGVDGDVFTMGEADCEYDVIAMGSFIHPRKGFAYLLQAYQQFSDAGLRIADIGRRSDKQRAALAQIPVVQSFGTIPGDQLIDILQKSSVLISVSLYEGFGLSLIEALACGKPAFAFGGGAVQEVLDPIDEHLTVPDRDTGELVSRVVTYLSLPKEQRSDNALRLRSAVLDLYNLKNSAKVLKDVYRSSCCI